MSFDLLVECHSSAPHAKELAEAVQVKYPAVLRANVISVGVETSATTGESLSSLLASIALSAECPPLGAVSSVLIVDDVFSKGTTAVAVLTKLHEAGLPKDCSITIGALLYM